MNVQVLVAAMYQEKNDFSLLDKMNIQTDVIVGNQCDYDSIERFNYKNRTAIYLNFKERGVGLNRNNALIRATGDFCLFADDDMKYVDDYEKLVLEAFERNPKADAIVFNIDTIGADLGRRKNNKTEKVHFWNALNYGTPRIAVRLSSIEKKAISFNKHFGGGAIYSFGEDTLFIVSMLKNGFNIYTYPKTIATVDQSDSTWFKGYTPKYFYDKGALYGAISRRLSYLLCAQDIFRHKELYSNSISVITQIKCMIAGIKGFSKLTPYNCSEDE